MAIRSVDEIINLSDSSKNPEKLALKDLVKHIDPRIRDRATRHSSLHFKIPGIMWGQPVYDAQKVEKMIIRHYKRLGFRCERQDTLSIVIRWGDDQESQGSGGEEASAGDGAGTGSGVDDGEDSDPESTTTTESEPQPEPETETESDGASDGSSDGSSDGHSDTDANTTKCVTVEQIPLSKRLSIVNNQMRQDP